MAYGIIGYSQPGQVASTAPVGNVQSLPSGSIFGDCSSQELIDEGTGFFIAKDFKDTVTLPDLPSAGTFAYVSSTDSAISMSGTSTGAAMWTKPLAPIAVNGTTKLWFEANVSLQSSTAAQGVFVGLATSTGLVQLSVAQASSTAGSTLLTSTAGYIGFFLHGDVPNNFDAVYQKGGSTAALSSTITVLAAVLTASQNNPNPANVNYVPTVAPGVQNGLNWVKLGLRIDKSFVYYFVNGSQVAKKAIDNTFDLSDAYGGIIAITTATGTAGLINDSFFRAAAKLF